MPITNKLIPTPFARDATSSYINEVPQTTSGSDTDKASYAAGFPPRVFLAKKAGGMPVRGQDFNGVLNDITTAIRYIQSGNFQVYNSSFSSSIGGYDKGAVLLGSDGNLYQSTVNANKNNPVGGAGWASLIKGDYLPISGGTLTGSLTGTDITANNITAKTALTVGSAKATYSDNRLNFDKSLLINNVQVLKQGDAYPNFGYLLNTNLNTLLGTKFGFYYQITNNNATLANNYPIVESGSLVVYQNGAGGLDGCSQQYTTFNSNRVFLRNYRVSTGVWTDWVEVITTSNIKNYSGVAYITETYTSADGLGWYRKWSDGWIEQGLMTKSNIKNGTVINFVIPLSGIPKTLLVSKSGLGDWSDGSIGAYNVTKSTCKLWWSFAVSVNEVSLYVCGY